MTNQFDVIVVGGGHAGIEAAYAAAKMGSKTLLLTLDADKVGSMPCNPSVGGLGKGHIVFEVSALGGLMPQLCSKTYLQARMLNTRKGPAVQGLRLQIDKYEYSKLARTYLENTPNLIIGPHMAVEVLWENETNNATLQQAQGERINASEQTVDAQSSKKITGVRCTDGSTFYAPSVVITTGTFMRGLVHVGRTRYKAGRRGEEASYGLSDSLAEAMGVTLGRLKTGTPPRILRQSLDFTQFEQQECEKLDYLFEFTPLPVTEKIACYVAYTNETTNDIITSNLHLSALYSGNIKGTGPRYCPSIEDKVGRFKDRASHHVFIEPEGANVDEIYPAGLSTSLPLDVQYQYIRSIKGMENAVIAKCGYAIEYDCIQPTNLTHTLEAKTVKGLFLAGQINGTTGYEEAAGQGIIAGINAHLHQAGKPPFILGRQESYIGVMIDDLITLGAEEPYRMFTSRAERRLLLRQDNVFMRLMPYGRQLGLIDDTLWAAFEAEKVVVEACVAYTKKLGTQSELFKTLHAIEYTEAVATAARAILEPYLDAQGLPVSALSSRALLCIHAEIKYEGYLAKEAQEVEKALRYQALTIPSDFVYDKVPGLNNELQSKLKQFLPATIAQAQLIPGMTPAAISILIFQIRISARDAENSNNYSN
jgi:tRNA uridine 5-carboxymethylaminomethyl modification enzyme